MNIRKRILSLLLSLFIAVSAMAFVPTEASAASSAEAIKTQMNAIKTLLQGAKITYFTNDGKACPHASGSTCTYNNNCMIKNMLPNAPSPLCTGAQAYAKDGGSAWTCVGYAKWMFYNLFGHMPFDGTSDAVAIANARPGDFISLKGHAGIFYAWADDAHTKFYMFDGNHGDFQIHYADKTFNVSEVNDVRRSRQNVRILAGKKLTISAENGSVTGATNNSYYQNGVTLTLTATPNDGYIFTGWVSSNGGTFADSSAATTKFTMPNADTTITASFKRNGLLTASSWTSVKGTPSGSDVKLTGTLAIENSVTGILASSWPSVSFCAYISTTRSVVESATINNPGAAYFLVPTWLPFANDTAPSGFNRRTYTLSLDSVKSFKNSSGTALTLSANTTYYFKWLCVVGGKPIEKIGSFKVAAVPTVSWSSISSELSGKTAIFKATAVSSDSSIKRVGAFLSTSQANLKNATPTSYASDVKFVDETTTHSGTCSITYTSNGTTAGAHGFGISALEAGKTYYYKFYASYNGGYSYTDVRSFTVPGSTSTNTGTSTTTPTIEGLIATARSQLGYHEKATNDNLFDFTANSGNKEWNKYAYIIDTEYPTFYNGKKNIGPDCMWCDVFVDWCFIETFGEAKARELLCQPTYSGGAGCANSYNYFVSKGQAGTEPRVGAQVFYMNTSNDIYHTGIVIGFDSENIYTIEGNCNDAVSTATRSRSDSTRTLFFGYPNYPQSITVADLVLSAASLALSAGMNSELTAVITPTGAADTTVTWTSSDPSIATVSDKGVVTAIAAGTVTITATSSNGKSDSCTVTIVDEVSASIFLNGAPWVGIGAQIPLSYQILPVSDRHNVVWSSSDSDIISVSPNGAATALRPGTAIISIDCAHCGVHAEQEILVDSSEWVYSNVLPEDLPADRCDIEYLVTGEKLSTTNPGAGWELDASYPGKYVNVGDVRTSLTQLQASETLEYLGYYYFHYCNPSVKGHVNYKSGTMPSGYTYTHYDFIPDPNEVLVSSMGTDDDYPYYILTWKDGSAAYCYPHVTCAGSPTHDRISAVYYRKYKYQEKALEQRYTYDSGWLTEAPADGVYTLVRYKYKTADIDEYAITLPVDTATIESEAFEGCPFTTVQIPASCYQIGSRAFASCSKLTYVRILNDSCQVANDAFANSPNVIIVSTPGSAVEAWALARGYSVVYSE